jgi:hypothetical protein
MNKFPKKVIIRDELILNQPQAAISDVRKSRKPVIAPESFSSKFEEIRSKNLNSYVQNNFNELLYKN